MQLQHVKAALSSPLESTWNVYVVQCADSSLYTGIAVDVTARVARHNLGKGAKYTRARLPVKLKATWPAGTCGNALSIECMIKKLSRADKLALCDFTPSNWSVMYPHEHERT